MSITVHIDRAYNLPALDSNGKSDPFCKMKLSSNPGEKYKTKVIPKTLDPVWNETFEIPLNLSDSSDDLSGVVLKFELFDHDKFSRNDKMDEVELKLSKLVRGVRTKKVFKVKGTQGLNLTGKLHVNLTLNGCGREPRSTDAKLQFISAKKINFLKAFTTFGVVPTGDLVKDYKLLREKMQKWRSTDVTMEKVASLTFYCYDGGDKGSLTISEITQMADHMFSFMQPSIRAQNTKRQLQKWNDKHNANADENYSKNEFITLMSDVIKPDQFFNKEPITTILDKQDILAFKEQVQAWLSFVGWEKDGVVAELYDANNKNSNVSSDSLFKPFNIASIIAPQERPRFLSNLAQAFFEYYHNQYTDDTDDSTQLDNSSYWRMTITDFYDFFGRTNNKMKYILVKEEWDSYSLADFKTEFAKLSEMDIEQTLE